MLEEIVKSSAGLIWKIAKNFYGVDKNDLYTKEFRQYIAP